MIDLVALALLAALAYWGWRRGTVLTALPVGSLLAGYLGAFLLYRPIGLVLAGVFSVPPILAFPLGGMAAVIAISLLFRFVANRLKFRRLRLREDGWTPSQWDSIGGAFLGSVWALGIVVVLAWGGALFHGLTGRGPDAEKTLSGRLASATVGKAVYVLARGVTGDEVLASTMALVAVKPSEGAELVSRLVGDSRLRALFEEGDLRAAVMRSDFTSVMRSSAIMDLARDPRFLEAAERVRLLGDLDASAAPAAVTEQLVQQIAPMVRTAERLSRDMDVQRILQDSRVMERLRSGDIGGLAIDPDFNRLAQKLVESFSVGQLTGSRR